GHSLSTPRANGSRYALQNACNELCSVSTPENPRAEAAASIPPNCRASAETLCPWQLGSPGVPACGTVFPARENVMLNVGAGGVSLPMTSVPIRTQSRARFVLRIHACRSPVNGTPGDRGAD